ncbi:MAG TPA: class I SAM-dependent methyltransferase [Methylomirabilota bacterium]|nr:class I SAM-dependent methyltransferase [Methylomirabilota bacterium]
MALWPRPPDETPPLELHEISREVEAFGRGRLPDWEAGYLEYHRRRYQDTLRLLPPSEGRRLLDVGSFPGHLSALAQARGWEVVGLNNAIEGGGAWTDFLERCAERKITIRGCEVEREPFPLPTASIDAVLFCELFEHLHLNPFHTLKEIFRVLRPGGLLVLTTPNLRRVETLSRLWHGWGTQPPVSRAFHELFPSLLYHRHNREYTADELVYYLGLQGKDLYDFRLDQIYYSDALDAPHEVPGVLGQRVGARELRLAGRLRRLFPRLRGQLMARATRTDAVLVEWGALRAVEGFGPVEEDERQAQGFTRRLTFPFRLTEGRAGFEVPLPPGEGPALVSLVVANPDGEAPPLRTDWTLDGRPAATLELGSSPRPVRVHLFVPAPVAARGAVRVDLATTTWRDPLRGSEVGLHVGAEWVLAQRLVGPQAIDAAIARVRAERRAEESLEGWWVAAQSLYLPHRTLPATLELEPGDEDQLGPGWFGREDWGKEGAMRWTGGRAEAYLGHDGRAARACVRAYSGEPRLGPVSGRLVAERVETDGRATPAGEAPFTLAPDTWAELAVPLQAPAGLVRVTIHAEPLRVPRERVPGSGDSRGLGLAIKRVWLAR